MLLWRILAGALLTGAGWMAGQHAANRFERRLETLRQMQEVRLRLGEGLRRNEELPETLKRMGRTRAGEIMASCGRRMEKEEPEGDFWQASFEALEDLDEEDRRRLCGWFSEYVRGDRQRRAAELAEMGEYLSGKVKQVQKEKRECGRLYRNLGVMLGLAAAIMLI